MKFDLIVSTETPLELTDRSSDIRIDVGINIDLNTITSVYVVVDIYTNNIVIPTISTSIIGIIAVKNPGSKYVYRKYSTHMLEDLDPLQSDYILCLSILPTIFLFYYHDKIRYASPTIANLSIQMKMA